jgi:deoxyribodipyrimidine photo-lyase
MTPPRWLFWHRRDLRLADNLGLAAAAVATPALTGVVVLDPAELAAVQQAPSRRWFLSESLRELAGRWRGAGSRLLILQGDPLILLPRLAAATGAAVVTWNRGVEPAERERDRRVAAALQGDGVKVLVDWDQLLVAPETILTGAGDPYRVYGPFPFSVSTSPAALSAVVSVWKLPAATAVSTMSCEGVVVPPAKALVEANRLKDRAATPARSERLRVNMGRDEELGTIKIK